MLDLRIVTILEKKLWLGLINMTEETPQQAARYTSFGHDFQKLVAASSGVSNPVFEMSCLELSTIKNQLN